MSAPTADRMTRLLALVPYLEARPGGVTLAAAARDFAVTEVQLRKDLELLWVCGLPGHGPGDLIDLAFEGDRVRVTDTAGLARPLRLATDEAVALVVALGEEGERMPEPRWIELAGVTLPEIVIDPRWPSAPIKVEYALARLKEMPS